MKEEKDNLEKNLNDLKSKCNVLETEKQQSESSLLDAIAEVNVYETSFIPCVYGIVQIIYFNIVDCKRTSFSRRKGSCRIRTCKQRIIINRRITIKIPRGSK